MDRRQAPRRLLPHPLSAQTTPDDDETRTRVVVEQLKGQGFTERDAEHLARATGATPAEVGTAVANADYLAGRGELRSRRGFIRRQLETGPSLFEGVERKLAAAKRREQALDGLAARIDAATGSHLSEGDRARVAVVLGDARGIARGHHPRLQGLDAAGLARAVADLAGCDGGGQTNRQALRDAWQRGALPDELGAIRAGAARALHQGSEPA